MSLFSLFTFDERTAWILAIEALRSFRRPA